MQSEAMIWLLLLLLTSREGECKHVERARREGGREDPWPSWWSVIREVLSLTLLHFLHEES